MTSEDSKIINYTKQCFKICTVDECEDLQSNDNNTGVFYTRRTSEEFVLCDCELNNKDRRI